MTESSPAFTVRPCELPRDTVALLALDTSYNTTGCYEVVTNGDSITLQQRRWPAPRVKRFPLQLDPRDWTQGWVAETAGQAIGFIATELEAWNHRLAIRHFYVQRAHRRQGIGRQLLQTARLAGRDHGALTVWAETSNCNLPGIAAYQRLGFKLCGCDQSLYTGTPSADEFAVYLAVSLG